MTDGNFTPEKLDALMTRLRLWPVVWGGLPSVAPHVETAPGMTTGSVLHDMSDAADAITALRADVEALRARLAEAKLDRDEWRQRARDRCDEAEKHFRNAGAWQERAEAAVDRAAARDVLAERRRQIEGEGWTAEHDDDHDAGDLSGAAASYALNAACLLCPYDGTAIEEPPESWPANWDPSWWKPSFDLKGARRDLVKAGALILAEIERLDRTGAMQGENNDRSENLEG